MSKLKRKDINEVDRSLERIEDVLSGHGATMVTIRRELERVPLVPEVDRLEALLGGVRVALERMGGSVLPGVVADIHALRDQMAEFRRELAGYRGALMAVSRLVEGLTVPVSRPKAWSKDYSQTKPRRTYNRRKKANSEDQPQVEILSEDAALHNEPSEVEK